ncbi:invasion associated locus B family protein [Azospirillum doebereinerae]|uniref:invasion associated locus B family protein n=1 Tax=Azospirillum doebereinerae TaxID=92933 RepID=UPI00385090E5
MYGISGSTSAGRFYTRSPSRPPARALCTNVVTTPTATLAPEGKPRVIMTAPLGVLLAPGWAMSIDTGKPVTLPFESCQTGGCRMVADLDQSSLTLVHKARAGGREGERV